MYIIWFLIILLTFIIEMITHKLIAVWFCISGLISLILAIIKSTSNIFLIQLIVYLIGGGVLNYLLRNNLKKYLENNKVNNKIINKLNLNKKCIK